MAGLAITIMGLLSAQMENIGGKDLLAQDAVPFGQCLFMTTNTDATRNPTWKSKTLEKIRINVGQPELAFIDCPKNRVDSSVKTRIALKKCLKCKYHKGIKGHKMHKTPSYHYPSGHVLCGFRELLVKVCAGEVATHIKANKVLTFTEWQSFTWVRDYNPSEQLTFRNMVYDCLADKYPELMQFVTTTFREG